MYPGTGNDFKSLIKEIEEDGVVRYVTASLEETEDEDLLDISKRAEDKVVRAQVTVYFYAPGESEDLS